MDDGALREALKRLLAHGDAVGDQKMMKLADAKKNPPPPPEVCPQCGKPMMDNKCPACGYEKPAAEGGDEGGLADLLESGSKE